MKSASDLKSKQAARVRRIAQHRGVIALGALLTVAVTYAWLIFSPVMHQARFTFSVATGQADESAPADATVASDQVNRRLADLIRTNSFQDRVNATGYPIRQPDNLTDEARQRDWQRTVQTAVSRSAGTVTVTIRHSDAGQATIVARAAISVLTDQAQTLLDEPAVIIKATEDIQTKRQPIWLNLILSSLAALIVGGLAGGVLALLMPDRKATGGKHKEPAIIRPGPAPTQTLGAVSGRQALHGSPLRGGPPPGLPVEPDEDEI